MEPLTVSMTFATITSLFAAFKNEKKSVEGDEFQEFLKWLLANNHEETKTLIEENNQLTEGIKNLFNQNTAEILDKLNSFSELLVSVASNINGLSQVTSALSPDAEFPKQALSILQQFEEKQASTLIDAGEYNTEGQMYIFTDGRNQQFEYDDPRFIEDDFATLVELGLLRHDFTPDGSDEYRITRKASKLAQMSM